MSRPEYIDHEPAWGEAVFAELCANSTTIDFPAHSKVLPLPHKAVHSTVADQFAAKRAEAIAAVDKIAALCEANGGKPFFDKEFFLGRRNNLYPPGSPDDCTVGEPAGVKRIQEIEFFTGAPLFDGTGNFDVDASDIAQGSCGDCFMIAAIASIASFAKRYAKLREEDPSTPDLLSGFSDPIQKIFAAAKPELSIYAVMFYAHGSWEWVIVDGTLAVDEDGDPKYAKCGPDACELWPPILEKAYAKFHGSWDACDGGQAANAIATMTSGVRLSLDLKKLKWPKLLELGAKPTTMLGTAVRDDFVDEGEGGARGENNEENLSCNLYKGHAYSVLDVREAAADGKRSGWCNIMNPWLSGDIAPDMAGSDAWMKKHPKIAASLGIATEEVDDGKFWMSAADMKKMMDIDAVSFMPDHAQLLGIGGQFGASGRPADDIFVIKIGDKTNYKTLGSGTMKIPLRVVLGQHAKRFAPAVMGGVTERSHKILKGSEEWEVVGAGLQLDVYYHPKGCPTPKDFEHATKKRIAHCEVWWAETAFVDIAAEDVPGPGSYISIVPTITCDDEAGFTQAVPYYVRAFAEPEAELTFFQLTKGLHGAVGKTSGVHLRVEKPKPGAGGGAAPAAAAAAAAPKPKPKIVVKPAAAESDAADDGGAAAAEAEEEEEEEWSDWEDEEFEEWEEDEEWEDDGSSWVDSMYGDDEDEDMWGSDYGSSYEGGSEDGGGGEEDEELDMDTLREWFNEADEDGSNYLEKSELFALFTMHAPELSPSQVQKKIIAADTNGDNKISFSEFVGMMKALRAEAAADEGSDDYEEGSSCEGSSDDE